MLRTSKRSLQRFRSEYGLRYRKISRKSYYKESDVLEFISRNMEEVVQDGEKVLKMKGGGEEETGQGEKKRRRETCGGTPLRVYRKGRKEGKRDAWQSPGSPGIPPRPCLRTWTKGKRYDKKTDKRRKRSVNNQLKKH